MPEQEPLTSKSLQHSSKSQNTGPGLEGMGKVQEHVFGSWPSGQGIGFHPRDLGGNKIAITG